MKRFLQSAFALAFSCAAIAATAQTTPMNSSPTGTGTGSSTGTYSNGTSNQPPSPAQAPPASVPGVKSGGTGSMNNGGDLNGQKTTRAGESAYQMGDTKTLKTSNPDNIDVNSNPVRATRRTSEMKAEHKEMKADRRADRSKSDRRTMSDGTK